MRAYSHRAAADRAAGRRTFARLDFGAYFKALQADYICATIGKLPDDRLPYRCSVWP